MKLEPEDEKFLRVESLEEAKSRIKEYQNYGLTKFYISNKYSFSDYWNRLFKDRYNEICVIF